jgi:hypothetical protein
LPSSGRPHIVSAEASIEYTESVRSSPKPAITQNRISNGAKRRAEMAGYAYRHYGVRSFRLHPKLIVLHFTDSGPGSYPGVHALFNANSPNGGELPGVAQRPHRLAGPGRAGAEAAPVA